jgi:hypothetical protein
MFFAQYVALRVGHVMFPHAASGIHAVVQLHEFAHVSELHALLLSHVTLQGPVPHWISLQALVPKQVAVQLPLPHVRLRHAFVP